MPDVDRNLPEVMPIADAASILGCSVKTLRRAIDVGDLVASQIAHGRWIITRTNLHAFLDARATPRAQRITPAPAVNVRTPRRGPRPGGLREHLARRSEAA